MESVLACQCGTSSKASGFSIESIVIDITLAEAEARRRILEDFLSDRAVPQRRLSR